MKWSVRGACAALSSCLLLACALSAAAVGLKCFSLGSELKGEPFRLGTAAGAFYSGLLLAAGLSLLAAALLCCRPPDEAPVAPAPAPAPGPAPASALAPAGDPDPASGGPGGAEAAAAPSGPVEKASPGGRQNFLLLGVLVFMLGVLSAFAGAVIDGDTVSLVERKYSHYCLLQPGGAARPRSGPAAPDGTAAALRCQKLRDYQQGLVLSTVFNALECLLGLLNLLLVKNYKAAQQRGRRRRRRRAAPAAAAAAGGRRRRRRGGGGGRRAPRHSQGSLFSGGEPELSPGDCPFQAVSYINVGVFHVFDEAGVEVHCGGHPSVELPGYSPMDPELNASYPYCYPLPSEHPPAYEEIYPGEPCAHGT
ncbi:transmembrane protein 271 [Haemorhous mexicanus]|uniref:transmembrane protein 271 n=1 Tax=Haemorhous mexicanus TaxID=30427 RepID=UPI0028BD55D5|nr:transmembrane protein 271 [Haemorhous mexicanus]